MCETERKYECGARSATLAFLKKEKIERVENRVD